jgi:hypothetical protein
MFWLSPVSNSYANLLILLKIGVRANLLCHFTITNSSVLKYLCLLSEFGLPIKMFHLSTCPEMSLQHKRLLSGSHPSYRLVTMKDLGVVRRNYECAESPSTRVEL